MSRCRDKATSALVGSLIQSKSLVGRDRLVVRTLRCGRSNPGSNPGHGMLEHFCMTFLGTCGGREEKKVNCVGRESNPDQLLGRQLC